MSYSPDLSSAFNGTKMRSHLMSPSGMCSFCTEECTGTCEIGLSAMRGELAVYPTNTGANQIASEKVMPIDYSHFNINGRVFGAAGCAADEEEAEIFNVRLQQTIGTANPVKLALPVILPALIKLNWKDYFAGAAMAGVNCVIGEGSPSKDPNLEYTDGKISKFEKLNEMLDAFRAYDRGYGQIILQCNTEDDAQGLPEYAITKAGATAIEFKFGQSAKGTQPAVRVKTLEEALAKQKNGALVHPNPSDPAIVKAAAEGCCPNFFTYSRLPQWSEAYLVSRVEQLRALGLKNVYFKMAGFDPADMERVLRIAAACGADMVTFDGAGGGSGYSPCKMMNEWGYPAVLIEAAIVPICRGLEAQGIAVPAIAITGGFVTEDQVYKALALGAPYVKAVGLCRSAMAAAMTGKKIGDMIEEGNIPAHVRAYGTTKEEVFADLPELRWLYGKEKADAASTGAIGVYSYLRRIAFGVQHFAALNRKFDIALADSSDLIPLTPSARDILNGEWF
ncbi:MAG: glutamate synthase-related protein [Pyramidobacter sp.]|nr:glutamate synthase-related protein [Pyramidobacter sp.]